MSIGDSNHIAFILVPQQINNELLLESLFQVFYMLQNYNIIFVPAFRAAYWGNLWNHCSSSAISFLVTIYSGVIFMAAYHKQAVALNSIFRWIHTQWNLCDSSHRAVTFKNLIKHLLKKSQNYARVGLQQDFKNEVAYIKRIHLLWIYHFLTTRKNALISLLAKVSIDILPCTLLAI